MRKLLKWINPRQISYSAWLMNIFFRPGEMGIIWTKRYKIYSLIINLTSRIVFRLLALKHKLLRQHKWSYWIQPQLVKVNIPTGKVGWWREKRWCRCGKEEYIKLTFDNTWIARLTRLVEAYEKEYGKELFYKFK